MTYSTIDLLSLEVRLHDNFEAADQYSDEHDALLVTSADDLDDLSGSQIVAIYNATADRLNANGADLLRVRRFSNKQSGIKRVIANIDLLSAVPAKREKSKPTRKVARKTGVNLSPKSKVYPCRAGTKQSILVDMLARKQGATMAELIDALSGGKKPWQEVTVKSGLNWDMNKLKGYGIRTSDRGGQETYHLTYPEGMTAPLPHQLKR